MDFYAVKLDTTKDKKVVASDMILTKDDIPTTAGSKMLDGYKSLFEAEVLSLLFESGYGLVGKSLVGEFGIDLVGETCYKGKSLDGKVVKSAICEIVKSGDTDIAIDLDVNGSVRRAVAQSGLFSVKSTYGAVSRYGTIPVACSGETISVISKTVDNLKDALKVIATHSDKDGTSLPNAEIEKSKIENKITRVAVIKSMLDGCDQAVIDNLQQAISTLKSSGVEVVEIDNEIIPLAKTCWNILMSAELCNNVSRYDGVKYGYRAEKFNSIDELYTVSRTETFGELLKKAILFGSETLSTENYQKVYDKALRMRRVIMQCFTEIFKDFGAVIMPACSKLTYTEDFINSDKDLAFKENFYTAPASICGLPTVVCGGNQLIGAHLSDFSLLSLAKIFEKGDK